MPDPEVDRSIGSDARGAGIGVEGVIIGAALHAGRFGLAEALALTRAGEADR